MKTGLFFLIVFISFFYLNAQDTITLKNGKEDLFRSDNSNSILPFGVAMGISSVSDEDFISSVSIDYFFSQNISAVITYGVFSANLRDNYYYIGLKKWFTTKYYHNHLSPYIGLAYGRFGLIIDGEIVDDVIIWEKYYYSFLETPICINYTTKIGLQTSFQLSHYFVYNHWAKNLFTILETPIGISYTTKFGLQTSLQLSYFFESFYINYPFGPIVKLKIGWRFNFKER